ncbi:fluoride efflux transporter CrcB [Streptomyces sp. SID3343]|nr:fluoride efflux transporter CrcB [Streptomyces sp. SID3343]
MDSDVEPPDADAHPPAPTESRESPRVPVAIVAVVSVGGVLGALARYGAGLLWPTATGSFPWTTFAINVIGCAAIGCLQVAATEGRPVHRLVRPFLGTGVLGGFTTFSTYCVDIEQLVDRGEAGTALAYLTATITAAMVAVTTGAWVARRVLALRSRR